VALSYEIQMRGVLGASHAACFEQTLFTFLQLNGKTKFSEFRLVGQCDRDCGWEIIRVGEYTEKYLSDSPATAALQARDGSSISVRQLPIRVNVS